MTRYIYFDYCAIVVEAIIIVSLIIRKMTRGRLNRWAFVLLADIVLTTLADITALLLQKRGAGYTVLKYVANTVRLWGISQTSVLFCGYIFAMIGIWHKIRKRKSASYVFNIPIVIMTLFLVGINPFTGVIFSVDGAGMYLEGPLLFMLYGMSLIYLSLGLAGVIKYRRLFSKRRIFSVFVVIIMILLATILQAMLKQHYFYMFFLAAAFLMIVLGIQSPEERVHGATGLLSMNAYVNDVNKYRALRTPIGVTLSVMTNYSALIEMLGFFTVQDIIFTLARRLEEWAVNSRVDVDMYYLGGGRFAVIADDRYEDTMLSIAHGVNGVFTQEVALGEMLVKVMNNVCFVSMPKDIDDPRFLFSFDSRLETEVYSGELRYAEKLFDKKRFELRRDIAKVIDRAFEQNLFRLQYQPIYSVKDRRFVRAEAFLRLNDPEFGNIAPDLLISEAEKINSIHAITTFVIEEVCAFLSMSEFLLLGLEHIEINLSPVQCMWSELLPVLLSTVKRSNVQPKNICFNITDVDNQEIFAKMHDNIAALSQVGFKIYMDDFGAGIFEVERIANMPLSGIKLDRTFVREGLKRENTSVFEGSLHMIEDLAIDSVAGGVEDEQMEKSLMALNCNYLQGYRFCRPMDKKEFIRFILME
ncbi:MAG: EAL domain-containing protein [Lachnospiraceae bacterium]|nr:EAL domain-containing protein [Lachnospiraceae bacterium]